MSGLCAGASVLDLLCGFCCLCCAPANKVPLNITAKQCCARKKTFAHEVLIFVNKDFLVEHVRAASC